MENMGSGYWRVEFIRPAESDDDRCVLLHGQLEEIVGPMTIDMAEAWIDRFDGQASVAAKSDKGSKSAVPEPKFKSPKSERTR